MNIKDFFIYINKHIFFELPTYINKRYIEIPIEAFRAIGVKNTLEVQDLIYESYLYKLPYELNITFGTPDFMLKVSSKYPKPQNSGFYLYKYYINDKLMYIGRTLHPLQRYFQHIKDNPQYKGITHFEIYECKNKADMLLLERLLIGKYSPPWNIVDKETGETSFNIEEPEFKRYNLIEFVSRY